jgi:hypothetical protein
MTAVFVVDFDVNLLITDVFGFTGVGVHVEAHDGRSLSE